MFGQENEGDSETKTLKTGQPEFPRPAFLWGI